MKLIAVWKPGRSPVLHDPCSVRWEDGSDATLDDLNRNIECTRYFHFKRNGVTVLHIIPDIVADLHWDPWGGHWSLTGTGIEPVGLWISDPAATDSQLKSALMYLPITFKVIVHRGTAIIDKNFPDPRSAP